MTSLRLSLTIVGLAALPSCALRPSHVHPEQPVVMVKSVRLPARDWIPWYTRVAEHLWVDFFYADTWHRIEWGDVDHIRMHPMSAAHAFADERWGQQAQVHACFHGVRGARIAQQLAEVGRDYPCAASYRAWPGPNSNSFVVWLAHRVDMPFVPPTTAIGKDFTTWLHAGVTASGLGVELETLPLGVELGLREGVELHLLGMTAGVGLWPPSLKLPLLPAIPGGWFAPGG
ncbi:MAG: DUF3750 domain-containing protein [Planctomycetes bacterium]|nr:DUF3750 domain-containing protein [Planctomycetota bacterium]